MKQLLIALFFLFIPALVKGQVTPKNDCSILLFNDGHYKYVVIVDLNSEKNIFYILCDDSTRVVNKIDKNLAIVSKPGDVKNNMKKDTIELVKIQRDTIIKIKVDTIRKMEIVRDTIKIKEQIKTRFYFSFNYANGQPSRQVLFNDSLIQKKPPYNTNNIADTTITAIKGSYFKGNKLSLEFGFTKKYIGMYLGFSKYFLNKIGYISESAFSNSKTTKSVTYNIQAYDINIGFSANYGFFYTKLSLNCFPLLKFNIESKYSSTYLSSTTNEVSNKETYINESKLPVGFFSALGIRIPLGGRMALDFEAAYSTISYRVIGLKKVDDPNGNVNYTEAVAPKFRLENYSIGANLRFYFNKM